MFGRRSAAFAAVTGRGSVMHRHSIRPSKRDLTPEEVEKRLNGFERRIRRLEIEAELRGRGRVRPPKLAPKEAPDGD